MSRSVRSTALIASAALSAIAASAELSQAAIYTIDVDLAGWVTYGSFTDPSNTSMFLDLGPSADPFRIEAVEWIDLDFTTLNGSYQSELTLSLNQSSNTGLPGTFWDHRPGSDFASSGTYIGSGSFTNPSNAYNSRPFTLLPDNQVFIYVYESFDDGGASVQDAVINSGTLRITYTDNPPPPTFTTSFSGSNIGGPTFNRPVASGTSLSLSGTDVAYELIPFYVPTSGTYDISVLSDFDLDLMLFLYGDSFDPSDALANFIAGVDSTFDGEEEAFLLTLTAGMQYYLVVTSFFNVGQLYSEGTFTGEITGPGQAVLGVIPEPASISFLLIPAMALGRRRRAA